MKPWCLSLIVAALGTRVAAQLPSFELADFNITQALIDRDIDTSSLTRKTDSSFTTAAACSVACTSLKALFGSKSVLSHGSPEHKNAIDKYWSRLQMRAEPHCIFYPTSASDISKFILISRSMQCPFAVKSGGHGAFEGASNSVGGITVMLEKMNDIELSADKKIASVGAGNTWSQVYSRLDKEDLTVIGGRVSNIGVGGLTLGGGISFLSPKYGWACDNVESYEVVLANGEVVVASETSHPDLYWALRGGGNNFGIVTKFNYFTYELGEMYGGSRTYAGENVSLSLDGYHQFALPQPDDRDAAGWLATALYNNSMISVAELAYTKNEKTPAIFSKYLELSALVDNRQVRRLTNYTHEIKRMNPDGFYQIFHVITTKMNTEFNKWSMDLWMEESKAVKDVPDALSVYIFMPISMAMLENMDKRGGNPLGLNTANGPYQLHLTNMWWADESHESAMYATLDRFYKKLTQKAKEMGIWQEYIYMNYASQFQDPIASYGKANKAKLEAIAAKYDPTEVFQKLQPGYFKLKGGPYAGYEGWLAQKKKNAEATHDEL